jgi:hypothetical protein
LLVVGLARILMNKNGDISINGKLIESIASKKTVVKGTEIHLNS